MSQLDEDIKLLAKDAFTKNDIKAAFLLMGGGNRWFGRFFISCSRFDSVDSWMGNSNKCLYGSNITKTNG